MKLLKQAVLLNVWLTILCGLLYPGLMTGLAQILFPGRANGSLIVRDGVVVGSELIGQTFTDAKWFHGRPSAAGSGYDPLNSSGSNLGPTSKALLDRIDGDVAKSTQAYGAGPLPADMVTASGSGLDPHITVASALRQAASVAKARGMGKEKVGALIAENTEGRTWGFLGEPRVNVLRLNLALEKEAPVRKP